MRLAFFSPFPPAGSGIADYSAALAGPLRRLADVEFFDRPPERFDPARFDAVIYQVGNNPWHEFCYRQALACPGIVVLHEANLHHLVAEITIKRGDWDAYLAEAGYDGGEEAAAYARRVRALEVGPDYEGVAMLRRLVERSRAFVAHSRYVEAALRRAGFAGPVGVIPHGAWITEGDRMGYRHKLGLDETVPLIGIFGYLKPYKRIAESLRALRRLRAVEPRVKMILVGEPHPDLPLRDLISRLQLADSVRLLGFTPIEEFSGYMSACDIVLNLRFPTVGESSGSLQRALGLGRAAIVSDVGSFAELPGEVALKVPPGEGEEDLLFEYLNLLVTRPAVARALGRSARAWAGRECAWEVVAERYAAFAAAAIEGRAWRGPDAAASVPVAAGEGGEQVPEHPAGAADLRSWAAGDEAEQYIETHLTRLEKTLSIIPPGGPEDRILEMGAYLQITPALKSKLGYGEVRGCYYGEPGRVDHREVVSSAGERFTCDIDHFDAEKHVFPYPGEWFATVLCCELIEHLAEDPMHMMAEINRILRPGGRLVLTTPNVASLRAIGAILNRCHPGFFPAYIRPRREGEEAEARHNREYAPAEIARLLDDAGFTVERLETGPFRERPKPEHAWIRHMLDRYGLPADLRGDGIYAVGRKTGPVRERHPGWLYQ